MRNTLQHFKEQVNCFLAECHRRDFETQEPVQKIKQAFLQWRRATNCDSVVSFVCGLCLFLSKSSAVLLVPSKFWQTCRWRRAIFCGRYTQNTTSSSTCALPQQRQNNFWHFRYKNKSRNIYKTKIRCLDWIPMAGNCLFYGLMLDEDLMGRLKILAKICFKSIACILFGPCVARKILSHTHVQTMSTSALQHYAVAVSLHWWGPSALET